MIESETKSPAAENGGSLFDKITVAHPAPIAPETGMALLRAICNPLTINIVSFFVLSLLAFREYAPYLFYGFDGGYEASLVALNSLFVPPLFGYTNDFIHGLGNIWFTVNPRFLPEYFLSVSRPGQFSNFPLTFAISATNLFIATYAAGRLVGVPRLVSLIAAWLVPLVCFQYSGWPLIPNTFRGFPHYATVAAVATVTSTLLLLIGRSTPVRAIILGIICFLAITYIVVVAPMLLVLPAPHIVMFGIVALLGAAKKRRRLITTGAVLGAILVVCAAMGYISFTLGLAADTAASFFPKLSIRPLDIRDISMLFWFPVHNLRLAEFFTVERSYVLFGLLGGLWAVLRGTGVLREAALAFVGITLAYIAAGLLHLYHPFWIGPAFWYFEGFLFPFHAIFAAFLVVEPVWILGRAAAAAVPGGTLLGGSRAAAALPALAIAVLPWFYVKHRQEQVGPPNIPIVLSYPQQETPITRILKDEIALKPGGLFRGREATMTGRIFPLTTLVDMDRLAEVPNILGMFATGNMHQAAALWQDAIPTVLEDSQLITPDYFAFLRTFFSEPVDRPTRNIVVTRRIDPRLLAAIGVRFVVTDAPFAGEVHLRQVLDVPVTAEQVALFSTTEPISSFKLYLYELDRVNVGQYSPTDLRVASRASEILELLGDPSLDLTRTAVVSENVAERLVAADHSELRVGVGDFGITAHSAGRSMIVLPIQFSQCLQLKSNSGGHPANARLVRADFLMTGILFEGQLDVRIEYRSGPLNSWCRLHDTRDMESIEIRRAFEHHPDMEPRE